MAVRFQGKHTVDQVRSNTVLQNTPPNFDEHLLSSKIASASTLSSGKASALLQSGGKASKLCQDGSKKW